MNMRGGKQLQPYYALAYNPVENAAVLMTRPKDIELTHYDLYTLPKKAESAEEDNADGIRYALSMKVQSVLFLQFERMRGRLDRAQSSRCTRSKEEHNNKK